MKSVMLLAIRFYQKTFSPDHGWRKFLHPYGFCRFYPSCSEYAYQAIERHGAIVGFWMGLKRILRCNPWSEPGIDHVAK